MANEEQIAYWNTPAGGDKWVRLQERMDSVLAEHGELALRAATLARGEAVLDVGCGCGATAIAAAARVGPSGVVVGVDVSRSMLARARERAGDAGLSHLQFLEADAQVEAFDERRFDAMVSRYGVMFFDDPVAAFRNLRRAIKPRGRAAFVCWQAPERNPWIAVPLAAAERVAPIPPMPAGAQGPFAFADAGRVEQILAAAEFTDVLVRGERVPVRFGSDAAEAAELLVQMGPVGRVFSEGGAQDRERALAAIESALSRHVTRDGVVMETATWVVSARRGS